MNKEDLDALAGLYEGVYSPEESGECLSEELNQLQEGPLERDLGRAWNFLTKPRPGLQSAMNKPLYGNANKPQTIMNKPLGWRGTSAATTPAATTPAATTPAAKPPAATTPAAKPPAATTPAAKPPAAKPPAASAKVAPTAAAKPAGQTGDKAKDMATWAKANPTLANKPKTPNPLMQKTFGYQTGGAPDQVKKADASFARSKETANKMGVSGSVKALTSGYEWPSAKTINNLADAYASIYEAKKKDQDQDGDNDFADVQIARMIASGMSKAEAIAAVKNKEYNEEYELDEATRMRKELGKEGETRVRRELAARSKAYKRSGSVDKTIAAAERGADNPYVKFNRNESDDDRKKREEKQKRTLRGLAASRRKSVRSGEGLRGYAAKVEGGDKDLQSARGAARSAGTLTPAERKQLGEVYEIVASYLLENNFAETIDSVNVIIENMSGTWIEQILSEVY